MTLRAKISIVFVVFAATVAASPACSEEWVTKALRTQRQLAYDQPMNQLMFVGAHNAYNHKSITKKGCAWDDVVCHSLSPFINDYLDDARTRNQKKKIPELLELGVRSLMLDLHKKNGEVKLCHAKPNSSGCSVPSEIPHFIRQYLKNPTYSYSGTLGLLFFWLATNPYEIAIVDLEDRVDERALVENPIATLLQPYLFTPCDWQAGGHQWPTQRQMVESGRRLIVKSNKPYGELTDCGTAQAPLIFDHDLFKNADVPGCCSDAKISDWSYMHPDCPAQNEFSGYYGDDLTSGAGNPLTDVGVMDQESMAALAACNVNFLNADTVTAGRLAGAVWSWLPGHPVNTSDNRCVAAVHVGRWVGATCEQALRFACRDVDDPTVWIVSSESGPFNGGDEACAAMAGGNFRFDVPRNGWENGFLKQQLQLTPGSIVWINYRTAQFALGWGVEDATKLSPVVDSRCVSFNSYAPGAPLRLFDCDLYESYQLVTQTVNDELLPAEGFSHPSWSGPLCLEPNNYDQVLMQVCDGSLEQKWEVTDAGQFRNQATGECLGFNLNGSSSSAPYSNAYSCGSQHALSWQFL